MIIGMRTRIEVFSDSWKGFTKFTQLKAKPPKGYMWSGGRLTKIPSTSDHVWPEVWTKIGKAAQNREKQEWAKEKPKLDNARRLRGFTSSILTNQEEKEILKKMREKWKDLWHQPGLEKKLPKGITKVCAKSDIASEKTPKNAL